MSVFILAAHLLWVLELQHMDVLMPKLVFKVTGTQPEQAVGSQSKELQWAFSFSESLNMVLFPNWPSVWLL